MEFVHVCVFTDTQRMSVCVCVFDSCWVCCKGNIISPPLIRTRLMAKWTSLTFQRLPPSWLLTHYTPDALSPCPWQLHKLAERGVCDEDFDQLSFCSLALCLHPSRRRVAKAELAICRGVQGRVGLISCCSQGKIFVRLDHACVYVWLPGAMSDMNMVCVVSGNWVDLLYPDFM